VPRILTLFGTRPEIIKLAPVIRRLEESPTVFDTVNVTSAQHTDLAYPFVRLFKIRVDHDLGVMRPDQSPSEVCARVLVALDPLLNDSNPDFILVQGDTTTAVAGALAGFYRRIPVGHVEAGLRTDNPMSPFPEEMNRRLITRLATYHFAATERNRRTLLSEGVPSSRVFVTGNPVVDALREILPHLEVGPRITDLLRATQGTRRIVLTTHRRESFGPTMTGNLEVLRRFVESQPDLTLIFPVHPNPLVVGTAREVLKDHQRIHLIDPLGYEEFIFLLSKSWLIVSDSGGVQEEAPTLGKPVLILRENTERPEAVEAGVARLVGGDPARLATMLAELERDSSWIDAVKEIENPFGRGDSGQRIATILASLSGVEPRRPSTRPGIARRNYTIA
jgi:UDP-N-acetylglucosamine 2-epimerase (non-hydrolysing)